MAVTDIRNASINTGWLHKLAAILAHGNEVKTGGEAVGPCRLPVSNDHDRA